MIHFGELEYKDMGNGVEFMLTRTLWFRLNEAESITVPAGFVTDNASVPRLFWSVVAPHGKYTRAAVVHDYLYSGELIPRKKADEIFLFGMGVLGVPAWLAHVMYAAVRIGGAYNHSARSIAHTRLLAGYYDGSIECVDPITVKRPLFSGDSINI